MVCIIDYYLNAGGKTIMDNAYGYDVVSNVLSVVNKAAIPEKGKAGGQMRYNYTYDALYRLSTASGTYKGADNKAASYTLSMGYDNMHRITSKKQHLSQTGVQFEGTLNAGYELAYTYGKDAGRKFQLDNVRDINYRTEETPTEGMNINNGHKYTYDLNGNLVYINTSRVKRDGKEDEKATEQKYRWDEDNRLMVLSDNGKTSRYTYNAAGERIMKSYGTMEGVYINGAPQGITFHETDNFTLYPASIISINKNRFTKHYFIGDKRVASRIGTGLFNNVYGRNGSYVTAGQQDYAERMNQIQTQKEAYYKKVGVAPGVPTEKGAYGDPENTKRGYNSIIDTLGNHDVPQGWIQTPRPNTTPNTNPGPPVSWNDPSNPDDPQAGYGYIPNDTTCEETFFYHSDHLGSTSYITDDKANITQYDAYLPYGELLVDEHSSREELPYKFNGKQFDEETGLYYYGARCMNPKTSLWYGVDPLAEKYVSISPYSYCKSSPMNYIDEKGLYPKGIVTIHYERSIVSTAPSITGATMNVPTQYVYYKFTKSATHLLSLVSGVPENYIKNVRLEEFNLQRESNSITLGDSPENTRMLVSPEYFNEENISKEQYYNWWFKEFSHEVGHIKQIKRDGSEGLYLLKTLWGYVSTQSHDKAPREQEAEKGSEVFESFRDFVKSKFHANLNRLFIGKGSEEEKIRQIDKWWNAYKEQKK